MILKKYIFNDLIHEEVYSETFFKIDFVLFMKTKIPLYITRVISLGIINIISDELNEY